MDIEGSSSKGGIKMMLSGKTAVITGCSRGIGRAILEGYAENGADIFAVVRKEDNSFSFILPRISEAAYR